MKSAWVACLILGSVSWAVPAAGMHDRPVNVDPASAPEHVVDGEVCEIIEVSKFDTAKVFCEATRLIAWVDNYESETAACVIGIVHHHVDGTMHGWVNHLWPIKATCHGGYYDEVLTVDAATEALLRGGRYRLRHTLEDAV